MDANQLSNIEFGTCSWNYDSWIGLVYSKKAPYSAAYLKEYSMKYNTVEVDSWFYKIPTTEDAFEYKSLVPESFSFACKLPEMISLTHERNRDKAKPLVPNETFLSPDLYTQYLTAISELKSRVFMLELEFEYLNRDKMASLSEFMKSIDGFTNALEKQGIRNDLPLGIESRNSNYLKREYFQFLKDHAISHVFSEKQYLQHIYELFDQFGDLFGERIPIRLLGGDRKEIETLTNGNWNEIVDPKPELPEIAAMLKTMGKESKLVKVYVNNHFEGSAPKTIERIQALF